MRVQVRGSDETFDAIAFNCVDRGVMPVQDMLEASFKLDVNEWRGRRNLQLMIDHLQDPEFAHTLQMAEKEKNAPREIVGAAKSQKESLIVHSENSPAPF